MILKSRGKQIAEMKADGMPSEPDKGGDLSPATEPAREYKSIRTDDILHKSERCFHIRIPLVTQFYRLLQIDSVGFESNYKTSFMVHNILNIT